MMSDLISGKEALIALENGKKVEFSVFGSDWDNALNVNIGVFLNPEKFSDFKFRLKPQTITINNIEALKPKKIQTTGGNVVSILCETSGDALILYEALQHIFSEQPQ